MSNSLSVRRSLLACAIALCLYATLPPLLRAQATDRDLEAIASWVAVDAATGYERRVAPALASALGGWTADAYGNVVSTDGTGSPHRIVACALDRPSYAVSQIRDDGYLRLHRIGSGSRHPLWDQQFEVRQVRVLTIAGPVAGVIARTNGHFAQQHANETASSAMGCQGTSGLSVVRCWRRFRPGRGSARSWTTSATSRWRRDRRATRRSSWHTWTKSAM
jgi:M42 glutamyl aminopeptidase